MIIVYFFTLAIAVMGGLIWWVMNYAFTETFDVLELSYPTYFTGDGPTFLTGLIYWSLLFVVVITMIIYAQVQSQKPREVIY